SIPVTRSQHGTTGTAGVPCFRVQASPSGGIRLHRAAIARDMPGAIIFQAASGVRSETGAP
ncbi:MAG: hypothetical protein KDB13_06565, partial [Microthrixaceae bacterium]|nr:hypothetical protein [Microthrixaceae bacterium]